MGLGEEEMMRCVIPVRSRNATSEKGAPGNGGCKITTNWHSPGRTPSAIGFHMRGIYHDSRSLSKMYLQARRSGKLASLDSSLVVFAHVGMGLSVS